MNSQHPTELVAAAILAARPAGTEWSQLGFTGRGKVLIRWSQSLALNLEKIAEIIHEETGKPISDARLETSLAISHLRWAAMNAARVLSPSKRASGILNINMSAHVEHAPYGVVGVIGPWNYPIFTPMGSIGYALAAGNAIIFKPSEFTPKVAHYYSQLLTDVSPIENLIQVLPHSPEFGAALASSGVDKISFTGSTATGRKVAAACAANLTPHVLECGGKDAVIVDEDADVSQCAEAVLWASMSNAGQTCIGSERVYVHEKIADRFISEIEKRAREIHAAPSGNYGRMTMPNLINVIRERVSIAAEDGGEFVVGGLDSISGNGVEGGYIQPIVIKNLPEDSAAMKEEIFGPTLIINRVASMQEAIKKANDNPYGLGGSVWSKRRGKHIASQLKSGMVSINSVLAFASVASLPFGGVKASGYGRIHGEEGLKEFAYPHSVVQERFALPVKFTTFGRTAFADKFIMKLTKFINR